MYELNDREMIFVFTGPDGSGRKTVAEMVGNTLGIKKVISYCTRESRPGETDGEDYHFITQEQFLLEEQAGEFLESVRINDNLYGVKHKDIELLFKNSGCIYLVLNPDGADTLKRLYGSHVIRLFIYTDRDTIVARQIERQLSEDRIKNNTMYYEHDMAYISQCEHAFENLDLAHTIYALTNSLEFYLQRDLVELD
jgi:guanylate kinase